MSTPLIPITEQIMIMPLIGTMDTQRAQLVLETALAGAQSNRAQVVIIDITGMRHVDTNVASTLINTAKALRLLGAQAILTGIRAEIAQTLVSLGIDLGTIVTRGTLQSGIAYALGQVNKPLSSSTKR
jgi:anti-anti-sigma regulatory factor